MSERPTLYRGEVVDSLCKHFDLIVQRNNGVRWVTCTNCGTDFVAVVPVELDYEAAEAVLEEFLQAEFTLMTYAEMLRSAIDAALGVVDE